MITITIISFLTGALAGACTVLSYCLYSKVKHGNLNPGRRAEDQIQ